MSSIKITTGGFDPKKLKSDIQKDVIKKIKSSVIKKIIDRYENTTCPIHNEHPVISDIDIENNTFNTSFCCDVLKDMVKQ